MKDEIKEILRNCEKAINEASGYNNTTDKILDYITNLQRANKNHSKKIIEMGNKITNLQEENKRLLKIKKYAEDVGNKRNELYERIDKAIEFNKKILKENWYGGYEKENATKNINILQGSDKE